MKTPVKNEDIAKKIMASLEIPNKLAFNLQNAMYGLQIQILPKDNNPKNLGQLIQCENMIYLMLYLFTVYLLTFVKLYLKNTCCDNVCL